MQTHVGRGETNEGKCKEYKGLYSRLTYKLGYEHESNWSNTDTRESLKLKKKKKKTEKTLMKLWKTEMKKSWLK